MSLLLVAYPELEWADYGRIQECRKVNDKQHAIIDPHYTLVFPVDDISLTDFADEIKKQLAGVKAISVCLRNASVIKDDFSETWHTFLVPDEGYEEIVELHDKLYADGLAPHHRHDIKYIPHITIATSVDQSVCKRIAESWMAEGVNIRGSISFLDIISYENAVASHVSKVNLAF